MRHMGQDESGFGGISGSGWKHSIADLLLVKQWRAFTKVTQKPQSMNEWECGAGHAVRRSRCTKVSAEQPYTGQAPKVIAHQEQRAAAFHAVAGHAARLCATVRLQPHIAQNVLKFF